MIQNIRTSSVLAIRQFILVAIFALLFSNQSMAQNGVVNSTFDSDLSNWNTDFTSISVLWDSDDAAGSVESGSMKATHDAGVSTELIATQCVLVDENTDYNFGADFHLISGEPTTYSIYLLLYPYANTICSGGPSGSSSFLELTTEGAWTPVSSMLTTPATTQSIHIRVLVSNSASGTIVAAADNIWFGARDEVRDPLLIDGFETLK